LVSSFVGRGFKAKYSRILKEANQNLQKVGKSGQFPTGLFALPEKQPKPQFKASLLNKGSGKKLTPMKMRALTGKRTCKSV